VNTDSTTKGNWMGVYGSGGYSLVADATNLPTEVVTPGGASTWTWASSTSDTRALQRTTSGRVAATWYASQFTLDVNLTDGLTHQVALYSVDWDSTLRSQQVDVLDAVTQAVLDTRTLSNFNGGVYLVWNIKGHVTFRITQLSGANAVVSAIFFGPGSVPAPTPLSEAQLSQAQQAARDLPAEEPRR